MTGRFEHFDARPGGSYRLVLAHADASAAREVRRRLRHVDAMGITADLIDPDRVNLFERWESQAALKTFRRSAPRNKQSAATRTVSVAEYDIADVRPLFGKGRA